MRTYYVFRHGLVVVHYSVISDVCLNFTLRVHAMFGQKIVDVSVIKKKKSIVHGIPDLNNSRIDHTRFDLKGRHVYCSLTTCVRVNRGGHGRTSFHHFSGAIMIVVNKSITANKSRCVHNTHADVTVIKDCAILHVKLRTESQKRITTMQLRINQIIHPMAPACI